MRTEGDCGGRNPGLDKCPDDAHNTTICIKTPSYLIQCSLPGSFCAFSLNPSVKVSLCALPRAFLDICPCLGDSVHLHRDGEGQETGETGPEHQEQVGEEKTKDEGSLQSSRVGFQQHGFQAGDWRMTGWGCLHSEGVRSD